MFFKKISSYEYACANWKNFALSIAVNILSSVVFTVFAFAICVGFIWLTSSNGF